MSRQPIRPVTVSGWYEHTDGSFGYYSWHDSGGVIYTALDVTVPSWTDTFGPPLDELHRMRSLFLGAGRDQDAAWCELAIEGHAYAAVECIRLQQAGVSA